MPEAHQSTLKPERLFKELEYAAVAENAVGERIGKTRDEVIFDEANLETALGLTFGAANGKAKCAKMRRGNEAALKTRRAKALMEAL